MEQTNDKQNSPLWKKDCETNNKQICEECKTNDINKNYFFTIAEVTLLYLYSGS